MLEMWARHVRVKAEFGVMAAGLESWYLCQQDFPHWFWQDIKNPL
jgi:hypothetical protein